MMLKIVITMIGIMIVLMIIAVVVKMILSVSNTNDHSTKMM